MSHVCSASDLVLPLGPPDCFIPLIFTEIIPLILLNYPLHYFRDSSSCAVIYANYALTFWGEFLKFLLNE